MTMSTFYAAERIIWKAKQHKANTKFRQEVRQRILNAIAIRKTKIAQKNVMSKKKYGCQTLSDYIPSPSNSSSDDDVSKQQVSCTKRTYSLADELQILKTLIAHNPVTSITDRVVSSLRKSLSHVTKKQLRSKVSKLKKTYLSNGAPSRPPSFYELCSFVWPNQKKKMNNEEAQNKLNLLYDQPQFNVSGKNDKEKKQLLIQWLTFRAKERELSKQINDILLQALALDDV